MYDNQSVMIRVSAETRDLLRRIAGALSLQRGRAVSANDAIIEAADAYLGQNPRMAEYVRTAEAEGQP